MFSEKHFAAALMHLYIGTFSLAEIAEMASTTQGEVAFLRTQIDFMMLVDAAKASFAKHFREHLTSNEYPPFGYASIAAEYATFDEMARNQIRVPLISLMKQHADSISDKDRYDLPIDLYDLRSFKKLFSFFVFEKRFMRTLAKPSLQKLETIAKEIGWTRLDENYDEFDAVLSAGLINQGVREKIKALFAPLKLH